MFHNGSTYDYQKLGENRKIYNIFGANKEKDGE